MRKRWHPTFLIMEACRAVAIPVLGLPVVLLAVLLAVPAWLLWLLFCGLQAVMLDLRLLGRRIVAAPPVSRGEPAGGKEPMILELPAPRALARPPWSTWPRMVRRRHAVEDVRRSLEGMVRNAWSKAMVLAALGAVGARRAWTAQVSAGMHATHGHGGPPDSARELVHLRYRPDNGLFRRCLFPPARIDVWFDDSGRLVRARIWRERIRL